MTDRHHSFRRIASDYAGHSTVNQLRKQYVDGDTHTNTAESFGAILERAKLGVFHYMSSEHLSRYLESVSVGIIESLKLISQKTETRKST